MNDFEQYLRDNRPDTPAEDQFLIETNARLNAVEGIKQTVYDERRHGRIALLVALGIGLVAGMLLATLMLLWPSISANLALNGLDSTSWTKAIAFLQPWKYLLLLPVAGFAIALGILVPNRKKESF